MNPKAKNKKIARDYWKAQPLPSSDWLLSASHKIVDFIVSTPEFKSASQVGAFAALPWEPDLSEIWKAAPKKVVYPKIDIKKDRIDFFFLDRWEELAPGRCNILEPKTECPASPWKAGDIVLVPALALDKKLNRLGSGKGYYDRFLAEIPPAVLRWGVVFNSRVSETDLPVEDFDQKVDRIISEHR